MAKFFLHSGVVGLVRDGSLAIEGSVPAGASNVFEFDDETNAGIVSEFAANCGRFTVVGGTLRRDGIAVSFAAESVERTAKRELKDQIQDRLDEVQAVIDGVDASTNAQLRTMVKTLARNQKRILRMLKGLL